jgi:poly(3-hydroxyalkanoate) synthetase
MNYIFNRIKLFHSFILFAFALPIIHCSSIDPNMYKEGNYNKLTIVSNSGYPINVRYFQRNNNSAWRKFSVIMTSPVIFKDSVLYSSTESLIQYLNDDYIDVWLIEKPEKANLKDFGSKDIPLVMDKIRALTSEKNWIAMGVSIGGQAIMHFVIAETQTGKPSFLNKVVFLGTGFDYNYPNSFSVKLKRKFTPKKTADYCGEDFCKNYYTGIKNEFISSADSLMTPRGEFFWLDSWEPFYATMNKITLPAFFAMGRIDSVSPVEAVHKVFVEYGTASKNALAINRFFIAAEVNSYAEDFDHYMVIKGKPLEFELLPEIIKWIEN